MTTVTAKDVVECHRKECQKRTALSALSKQTDLIWFDDTVQLSNGNISNVMSHNEEVQREWFELS